MKEPDLPVQFLPSFWLNKWIAETIGVARLVMRIAQHLAMVEHQIGVAIRLKSIGFTVELVPFLIKHRVAKPRRFIACGEAIQSMDRPCGHQICKTKRRGQSNIISRLPEHTIKHQFRVDLIYMHFL